MKRDSTTIYIKTNSGDIESPYITPVPWDLVNSIPLLDNYPEPTKSVLWQAFKEQENNIVVIPDPVPQLVITEPNWDALNTAILEGTLNPMYTRLFSAAFGDLAVNAAFTVLIPSIQSTRIEATVASAFTALNTYTSYRFFDNEVVVWNKTVDLLGFSELMHLQ
jgi:hypothetical protein